MTMRALDLWYSAVWLAGSAALLWSSLSWDFGDAPISGDPAWFPQLLLVIILIAAAALGARSLAGGSTSPGAALRWKALVITLGISALYLVAYVEIGFIPSTLVLVPVMSWLLGFRRQWVIGLITVVFTVGLWYAFALLLNVTPTGPGLPTFG